MSSVERCCYSETKNENLDPLPHTQKTEIEQLGYVCEGKTYFCIFK